MKRLAFKLFCQLLIISVILKLHAYGYHTNGSLIVGACSTNLSIAFCKTNQFYNHVRNFEYVTSQISVPIHYNYMYIT